MNFDNRENCYYVQDTAWPCTVLHPQEGDIPKMSPINKEMQAELKAQLEDVTREAVKVIDADSQQEYDIVDVRFDSADSMIVVEISKL
jgi:hypothetical protein